LRIDIRDDRSVLHAFAEHKDAQLVLHLAGQVAVTASVTDPRTDFEINALGTFNVLEAMRLAGLRAPLIYSSTNKVYGGMEQVAVASGRRYGYAALPHGVSEEQPLDFHSPYGCSKGAGEQYVRDYHRIYGLQTVVFRQSCIYGYRQFGGEDQGWVAWFAIAAQTGRPITVYGDGKQVRDILFIEDLLDAYDAAAARIATVAGRIYNVGGGPENVISLLDLLEHLEQQGGRPLPYQYSDWRPGDQRIYISDIRRAHRELQWTPKVTWQLGLNLLYDWVAANLELFTPQTGLNKEEVLNQIPHLAIASLPVTVS
jgi:CDP-paratose 2-epimerase